MNGPFFGSMWYVGNVYYQSHHLYFVKLFVRGLKLEIVTIQLVVSEIFYLFEP